MNKEGIFLKYFENSDLNEYKIKHDLEMELSLEITLPDAVYAFLDFLGFIGYPSKSIEEYAKAIDEIEEKNEKYK